MKWTYIPSYAVFSCFLPVKYNSLSVVFIKSAPLNAFAPSSPILFSVHFFINHYCFVHCILVSVSHVQVSEQLMLCSSSAIHLTFSLLHMWFCFLLTTSHNYCFCCVDIGLYICCLTGQIKLPNCMIFQCEKDAQPHNFMVSYLFSCCNLCEKLDNWWHNKNSKPGNLNTSLFSFLTLNTALLNLLIFSVCPNLSNTNRKQWLNRCDCFLC